MDLKTKSLLVELWVNAVNRYIAYSNVNDVPEITAFDAYQYKPAKAKYGQLVDF
jgi:hypothetical protein